MQSLDNEGRRLFYREVVEPYRQNVARLFAAPTYHFKKGDRLARDLRLALVAHSFHPALQDFSGEFALLHRSFYGVLNLLTRLECEVRVKMVRTRA